MNILIFAHDSSMYGASQSLLTALKGISKKKERRLLVLLPNKGPVEEAFASAGIQFQVVPFPRCIGVKSKSLSFIQRVKKNYVYYKQLISILPRVEKIVIDFKPNVIYTNTSIVYLGYLISKRLNINHVWHVREFGDSDYNFTYYPYKQYIARGIAKSRRSIFGSAALEKAWLPFKNSNTEVVYNGIFDKVVSEPVRSLNKQLVRIGLLGAIFPGKGQDVALEAFARLSTRVSHCRLIIYGDIVDTAYYEYLQRITRTLDIENKVSFEGFVSDKEVIYRNLDVILNCSKTEGFGRTIIEGMMHGIPVIANKAGGIPEIIEDKVNGLFYYSTADSLAEVIATLLSDEKLYYSLSKNGIENAKKYSIERYVDGIDRILFEASKEGPEIK